MRRLLQLAKDHIILFGTAKFLAGLIIGFGLGVYFSANSNSRKGNVRNRTGRINQQRTGSD